jgi:hypothetical protein
VPYELTKSHFSLILQKDVATGSVVAREGTVLQAVLESGVEKVKYATAGGTEKIIGFAISDNEDIATDVEVESITVPAAAPYTVQLGHLQLVGTGASAEAVVVTAAGVPLTKVAGVPGAGEWSVVGTTGVVTFNVAQVGLFYLIYYRYNLTVLEAR